MLPPDPGCLSQLLLRDRIHSRRLAFLPTHLDLVPKASSPAYQVPTVTIQRFARHLTPIARCYIAAQPEFTRSSPTSLISHPCPGQAL